MADFRPPRHSTHRELAHTFCVGVRLASRATSSLRRQNGFRRPADQRHIGSRCGASVQLSHGRRRPASVARRLAQLNARSCGARAANTLGRHHRLRESPWQRSLQSKAVLRSLRNQSVGVSRPTVPRSLFLSNGERARLSVQADPMTMRAFGELSKSSHTATGRLRSRCLPRRPMTARCAYISVRRRCPSFLN